MYGITHNERLPCEAEDAFLLNNALSLIYIISAKAKKLC